MKKAVRLFLLALVILSIPGCIEVVYEITVDENDVEHLTTRMGMPALLAPYLGEVIADLQNEGFVVTTETRGDKVWIVGAKEFAAGSWDIPALPSTVTITSVDRDVFQVDDYVLFKRYTLDVEYRYQGNDSGTPPEGVLPPGGGSTYTVPVTFVVTLPGRIMETNAHERQGRAAVWNFTLAPNGTIAMSLVAYKPNWALVSALLACLAVFAVALVMLAVRSSGSRTAPPPRPQGRPATVPGKTAAAPVTGDRPPGGPAYLVTLSLPADIRKAEKIIQTLAKRRKKTAGEIIAELKAGKLTIGFTDHALLEKNLPILRDAGFNPRVTVRGR
jgi:hypothetical protein